MFYMSGKMKMPGAFANLRGVVKKRENRVKVVRFKLTDLIPAHESQVADYLIFTSFRINSCHGAAFKSVNSEEKLNGM